MIILFKGNIIPPINFKHLPKPLIAFIVNN